ncbi:MAG: lasso peptide biosynthesis B2 protein [Thermoleophilaceae bacterium]
MSRVVRRLRVLRRSIRTPGDAWLAARMAGWRLVLPVLKRALPLSRLVRLMWSQRHPRPRDPAREERIKTLAEALGGPRRNPRLDNCLERSLVSYRYLARAGAEPELVVGVSRDQPVRGHAWVRLDGEPVRDAVEEFEEITAFGRAGAHATTQPPPDRLP